jgi:hypothetical protein
MKHYNALENPITRRLPFTACATALAVAFTVSGPQPAHAEHVTPPRVPPQIKVEEGNVAFLVGHAVGTQNYICLPSGAGFKFVLFTPEATLFKDADNEHQIITHYFSPNLSPIPPEVANTIRATWQDRDTSTVWAKVGGSATFATDPDFVAPDAVAWLVLPVVGAQDGPTGGHTLTAATFVQRLNTSGGLAPPTGCSSLADVGTQAFVPYTADYFFYKQAHAGDDDDN